MKIYGVEVTLNENGKVEHGLLDGVRVYPYVVNEKEGGYEILFPAVPEFVRDIDLTAETATIAPPEGLLDLYREGASADVPDDGQARHRADESL